MKFSEQWLREWVNPPVDVDTLCDQLTRAGLEVDSLERAAPPLDGVVVAEIVHCEPHPDADRLQVCRVETGGTPLQIVCGAPNARVGIRVPLATVGAVLPGGKAIGEATMRGITSSGMLCSAAELGISDDAAGLLELPAGCEPGQPLSAALKLDDAVVDVDLTPNRGDCLSIEGIAREVAVLNGLTLAEHPGPVVAPVLEDTIPVRLDAPDGCARYAGRIIRGLDRAARTPWWMQERLRRCGVRSLGPVVDVTNYVMLEFGQPMHGFDLGRITGGIHVRYATPGEALTLLDGSEVELTGESLVIADDAGAVALAGVMGGASTAVDDDTVDVFFESAWFAPTVIRREARRLGLHTDASHRFERHVAAHGQVRAIERATELLRAIAGGEPGPVIDVRDRPHLPAAPELRLRADRIQRVLGVAVPVREVEDTLGRLGLEVQRTDAADGTGWSVKPPPYRPDLTLEVDLIEEVARVRGLDAFADRPPLGSLSMLPRPEARSGLDAVRGCLVSRGFQEIVSYSFVDSRVQGKLFPDTAAVPLSNPISSEMDVMRLSLWPGLLLALDHNAKRQHGRLRLFESGRVFPAPAEAEGQPRRIGGLLAGAAAPPSWSEPGRAVDFYDARGEVEALVRAVAGAGARLAFRPGAGPALHPGQSARVLLNEHPIGEIGVLHPSIARALKVAGAVVLFELDTDALCERAVPRHRPLSRFPQVKRDLAVVLDEAITADALRESVANARQAVLQNLELFDLYRGEGIDSGKKSLAVELTFQAPDRTLEDAEVDAAVAAIVENIRLELGGSLRGRL